MRARWHGRAAMPSALYRGVDARHNRTVTISTYLAKTRGKAVKKGARVRSCQTETASNTTQATQPVAGLRQGNSHMPATANLLLTRNSRGHCKGHQMPGGKVQYLHRQWTRHVFFSSLHFSVVKTHGGLNQRIKSPTLPPWPFVAICAQTNHHQPGTLKRQLLRIEPHRSQSTGAITLDKNMAVAQQVLHSCSTLRGAQIGMARPFAPAGIRNGLNIG